MTDAQGGPSIRVFVGNESSPTQSIYLPPLREGVAPRDGRGRLPQSTSSGEKINPLLRTQDVMPAASDGDPGEWLLVGAAMECGVGTKTLANKPLSGLLSVPAWKSEASWYIFSRPPTSCDELLIFQQALLCIAQALSDVATATAPIHWKEVASLDTGLIPGWTIPPGEWTMLPQDQDSQFIALDLQRNVLAHLAKLDTYQVPGLERLCSHEYALELQWRPDTAEIKRELYGGKPGELPAFQIEKQTGLADTTISRNKSYDFAKIRLEVQTHTLRAASRMLEGNIRLAVAADMAGAERKRSKENDPLRGNEAAWGLSADGRVDSTQYNNYRHALRVLEGRLEMGAEGTPAADPACGGTPASQLISIANGSVTENRIRAPRIVTPSQQKALCLGEHWGIFFPSWPRDGIAAVRRAVSAQAVRDAARLIGIDASNPEHAQPFDEFWHQGGGRLVEDQIAAISDGDLQLAVEGVSAQVALVAGEEPMDPNLSKSRYPGFRSPTGLKLAADMAAELKEARGLAIVGGVPKSDLVIPIKARAGEASAASQCPEPLEKDTELSHVMRASHIGTFGSQNPFALGQVIRQRLLALKDLVSSGATDIDQLAAASAYETGEWAGKARVAITTETVPQAGPYGEGLVKSVKVALAGLSPEDVGASTDEQMAEQFFVVVGTAEEADCAAGLRQTCTEQARGLAEKARRNLSVNVQDGGESHGVGAKVVNMTFDARSIRAADSNWFEGSETVLYLIQRHDLTAPGQKGRVLAALALKGAGEITQAPISPTQDTLLDNVIGYPADIATHGCESGRSTPADSKQYCAGLARDMFIPLENELTSNGDGIENSFRHYLDLAKQASARADELGRQLVEQGASMSLRKESAQEDLASLCGNYVVESEIQFNGQGKLVQPPEGTPLRTCLDETRNEIVYLANMPPNGKDPSFIKELLRCGSNGQTNPLCAQTSFKNVTSLNLAPYVADNLASSNQCLEAGRITQSLFSDRGFDSESLSLLTYNTWANNDQVRKLVHGLRLNQEESGEWQVTFGGRPVMGSAPDSGLFPGCLRGSAGVTACDSAARRYVVEFSQAFRTKAVMPLASGAPACAQDSVWAGIPGAGDFCVKQLGNVGDEGVADAAYEKRAELESTLILWRVEGALWALASLAAEVPPGMFNVPIPVVDMALQSSDETAPLQTVFMESTWRPIAGQDRYVLFTNDRRAENAFGWGVHSIDTRFQWPETNEIPEWVKLPYRRNPAKPNLYMQGSFTAGNPSYALRKPRLDSGGRTDDLGEVIQERAKLFWKLQCNSRTSAVKWTKNFMSSYSLKEYPEKSLFFLPQSGSFGTTESKLPDILINRYALRTGWVDEQADSRTFGTPYCRTEGLKDPFFGLVHMIPKKCLKTFSETRYRDNGSVRIAQETTSQWTHLTLGPSGWTPADRIPAAINSYRPHDLHGCGTAAELASTMALLCTLSENSFKLYSVPPTIGKVEDIEEVERWIYGEAERARRILGRLYLEQVPARVVQDMQNGTVGSGTKDGTHGALVVRLIPAIFDIVNGWNDVNKELTALGGAVSSTRARLDIQNIQGSMQVKELALRQVQLTAQIVGQVASGLSSLANGFAGAAATGGAGALSA